MRRNKAAVVFGLTLAIAALGACGNKKPMEMTLEESSLNEAHKIAEERLGIVQQQGNIILTLQQQNAEYEAMIKRHWMSRLEFRRKYGEKK